MTCGIQIRVPCAKLFCRANSSCVPACATTCPSVCTASQAVCIALAHLLRMEHGAGLLSKKVDCGQVGYPWRCFLSFINSPPGIVKLYAIVLFLIIFFNVLPCVSMQINKDNYCYDTSKSAGVVGSSQCFVLNGTLIPICILAKTVGVCRVQGALGS